MIKVSKATKQAYMSDVSHKTLRVVFPQIGKTYTNDSIDSESLKLTESISSKDSIEFVGCIASSLQINIYGIEDNVKGKKIEVYIKADDTDEIPIFKGIVDSVVIDSKQFFKKITAYDVLYDQANKDVVDWYKSQFPNNESTKTMKQLRDSLFSFIGIEQVEMELPNDEIVISKKFAPKTLKSITVLKSICQFNGCFGIINRYGKFEYRFLTNGLEGIYPDFYLFPSATTFPQVSDIAHTFSFYETLKYEEYFVKPMERVQFRKSEDDSGQTVGAETGNKYIIQSNMFAQDLIPASLRTAAENILDRLNKVKFFPMDTKNNGLPFVECGDSVKYVLSADRTGRYATNTFVVLSRTLSGVQLLKDTYSAKGDEEQSEFITDLQAQLETIKMNGGGGGSSTDSYTKDEIDNMLTDYPTIDETTDIVADEVDKMEVPTGFNVVSVYTLPKTRANNTIYLIQGGVIIQ